MNTASKFTEAQKQLLIDVSKKPLLYHIKSMKPIHPLNENLQYRTFSFLLTRKLIEVVETDDTFKTYVLSVKGKEILNTI